MLHRQLHTPPQLKHFASCWTASSTPPAAQTLALGRLAWGTPNIWQPLWQAAIRLLQDMYCSLRLIQRVSKSPPNVSTGPLCYSCCSVL